MCARPIFDFVRVYSMFFQRLDGFADISAREAKALGGRPHVLRLDPVVIQTTCEYRRQTGEPGFDWGGRELKPREASGQRAQKGHIRGAAPYKVTGKAASLAEANYALTVQSNPGHFSSRGDHRQGGAGVGHGRVAVGVDGVIFWLVPRPGGGLRRNPGVS